MDKVYVTIGYYTLPLEEKLSWDPPSQNPPRKGNFLIEFISILLALSTIAVVLRLYTRAFIVYKLGLDDLLIIPGYLAAIGVNISEIYSLKAGWGFHVWDFDLQNVRLLVISGYCVQITITFSCLFTKLSLLVSYLRFSTPRMSFWVKTTMVFTIAWTLAFIIPCILACNPPHIYWDTYIRTPEQQAQCLPPHMISLLQYLLCGFNLLCDIIMMILPFPMVWELQLPRRQKLSLLAIFLAWIVVIVAAILRLAYSLNTFPKFDTLWYGYDLWVYVALEAHLAVVCACAPGFKPLIVKIWPKFDKIPFRQKKGLIDESKGTQVDVENRGQEDIEFSANPESSNPKKSNIEKGGASGSKSQARSPLSSFAEAERVVRAIIAKSLASS